MGDLFSVAYISETVFLCCPLRWKTNMLGGELLGFTAPPPCQDSLKKRKKSPFPSSVLHCQGIGGEPVCFILNAHETHFSFWN